MKTNTGFTLVEILTAVVIVTILITIAVPLYEKTIERSRMAEARSILAKLQDAKLYAMDNMGCPMYSATAAVCPRLEHLNVAYGGADTIGTSFNGDAFRFSLIPGGSDASVPAWWRNAVCARRLGGDYAGTIFLYAAPGVQTADSPAVFLCYGARCADYGYANSAEGATATMTCN